MKTSLCTVAASFLFSLLVTTATSAQTSSMVSFGGLVFAPETDTHHLVSIVTAYDHTVAVRSDGSVVGWGGNLYGQLNFPVPNTGFIAAAAGGGATASHTLLLKADGSIIAVGNNNWGQCNVPAPNADFVAVAAGQIHSVGLKADGTVVLWGDNSSHQTVPPDPNSNFRAIAAAAVHTVGLKANGSIVVWGSGISALFYAPGDPGFIAVATNEDTGMALRANGSVATWGGSLYSWITPPAPNTGFVAIAAGDNNLMALKSDGTVVQWGFSPAGLPSPNSGFTAIGAGAICGVGIKTDGSFAGWGDGRRGALNVSPPNEQIVKIAAGPNQVMGLRADGTIASIANSYQLVVPAPNANFSAIACGGDHALGVKSNGSVVCWGSNSWGQLNVPAPNSGFVAVAAGDVHSVGLKADGTVVGWGGGGGAQPPVPNSDFIQIAASQDYNLGLRSDGTVLTWSRGFTQSISGNDFVAISAGRYVSMLLHATGAIAVVGDVSFDARYTGPALPTPNTGFTGVAAGEDHMAGLKANGSVVTWGLNDHNQLHLPQSNRNFTAITAGGYETVAIRTDQVPVPVVLQHYSSEWEKDRVVLTWQLIDLEGSVTFEVSRREGDARFKRIENTVSSRGGGNFTLDDVAVAPGTRYTYRVVVMQNGEPVTSFETAVDTPEPKLSLGPNHPNPFNPRTEIPFTVDRSRHVTLAIYDVSGARVCTLFDGQASAGGHSVTWDGRDVSGAAVASGVYFARLDAGANLTLRLVLLK